VAARVAHPKAMLVGAPAGPVHRIATSRLGDPLISNLQLLRGLAALGVVFYHTAFTINGVHTEFYGVAIFFAISGFIMTYITREKGDWFLLNRVIRIVPLYWLVTVGYVLGSRLHHNYPWLTHSAIADPLALLRSIAAAPYQTFYSDVFWDVANSLAFVPYLDRNGDPHPLLGVGWTLNLEMFYYVLFAITLLINRRIAPLLVAVTLSALIAASPLACDAVACSFYGHTYGVYFVLGIGCYYAWVLLPVRSSAPPIIAGMVFFPTYLAWNLFPGMLQVLDPLRPDYLMPALVVFMALWLHKAKVRCDYALPLLLGAASYALYLTHVFVIETVRPFADFTHNAAAMIGVLVAGIALGIVVHKVVEAPMTRALHNRATGRSVSAKKGASA
jgi:exopolysaccharide production protein ExoZ